MIKVYDKTGKVVSVALYRTEQHMLMKQNIKLLRSTAPKSKSTDDSKKVQE